MTLNAIVQELGSDANAAASGFAIRTVSARIIQTLEASGQFENTPADDLFAALSFASGCVLHGLGGSAARGTGGRKAWTWARSLSLTGRGWIDD